MIDSKLSSDLFLSLRDLLNLQLVLERAPAGGERASATFSHVSPLFPAPAPPV